MGTQAHECKGIAWAAFDQVEGQTEGRTLTVSLKRKQTAAVDIRQIGEQPRKVKGISCPQRLGPAAGARLAPPALSSLCPCGCCPAGSQSSRLQAGQRGVNQQSAFKKTKQRSRVKRSIVLRASQRSSGCIASHQQPQAQPGWQMAELL